MPVYGLPRLWGMNPFVATHARLTAERAAAFGLTVTITSGHRGCAEQRRLRNKWLRGESPFPANRPGESAHQYGLAWDSSVNVPAWFWEDVRRRAGWCVPSNDPPHAEVCGWERFVTKGC